MTVPRCSCVGTTKKCKEKRDARAARAVVLLTQASSILGVLLAVAVVVSEGPYISQMLLKRRFRGMDEISN